ncbi:hemerythrin domain-containing protein [Aquabacterium humicola]|uniref:hemerythrin domain-containing protein n=1 Tax=Aquabacterium humicola TaxID=3237377 RepID=UPI002543DDA7|nr:hemerythrin domain-containing protein [Rubrivivax pictus]
MTEPDVSVPAVMRNYHEVLRNDLARVLAPLAGAGDTTAFATAWRAYVDAIDVHAAMEDGVEGAGGGITALLDQVFDGAAGAALFRAEHAHEHRLQAAVSRAIDTGPAALREAFAAYRAAAEAHLQHEEDVMMPLVARLPAPKAPLFASWCVSAGIAHGGFEHFVAHGVQSLSRHGSTKNTPVGATRVFVQALKAVCKPDQWRRYLPIARAAAAPGIWAGVLAEVPSLEHAAAALA